MCLKIVCGVCLKQNADRQMSEVATDVNYLKAYRPKIAKIG